MDLSIKTYGPNWSIRGLEQKKPGNQKILRSQLRMLNPESNLRTNVFCLYPQIIYLLK